MAIPRVLIYSHEDEPLFELDPQQLRGLVLNESINGEHSLTIDTEQELEKEQRVIVEHGGRWKEFVVTGSEERDAEDGGRSYYCAWSLQHDLSVAYIKSAKIGDAQHLHGATDAIAMVASATDRWQVGTVDNTSQSSGWFYYTSAWDALSRVVSQWAGEVDATITMSDPIRRAIDFYAEQGDQDAKRRFDYGRDLTEIQRNVLDDAFVCRIVPRGKGEQVEGSSGEPAYGRRITIESVNPTGEEWIQDDDAAALVRLPDGSGGWEYPTRIVIYEDIEEPVELLAAAQRDLQQYTRPKVGYSASVLALTGAGMDAQGVELGDAVQVVDRAFGGDGLRIEARVVGIAHNLLDDYDTQLTIGNFQPSTADVIKKLERAQSSMAEAVIDTDGKAEASMGIAETAQQVAVAVNQHFWDDTQGAHVTEVTKDEWLDQTGPLYQSGANSLWNSLGMLFRKGLTNLMALVVDDPDDEVLGETGVAIYDGQGSAAENIVASFTDSAAQIGADASPHMVIDSAGVHGIGDNYANVFDLAMDGSEITADYQSAIPKGRWDRTLLGKGTEEPCLDETGYILGASGPVKWANGNAGGTDNGRRFELIYRSDFDTSATTYSGDLAAFTTENILYVWPLLTAFDSSTDASWEGSLSGGIQDGTTFTLRMLTEYTAAKRSIRMRLWLDGIGYLSATKLRFYAYYTVTTLAPSFSLGTRGDGDKGEFSATVGEGLVAAGDAQTALGKYNASDTASALIIGNGTSDTSRSNAFTVDWSGNVDAAGGVDAGGAITAAGRITGAGLTSNGTITSQGRITGAGLTSNGNQFVGKSTNITSNTVPSAATYGNSAFMLTESAGNIIGYICPYFSTDNIQWLTMYAQRKVNGANKFSTLRLGVDSSGNARVDLAGTSAPAAWRTALGLGTLATKSSVSASDIEKTAWAYLVGSASTVASGNYVRWRMVAGIVFLQVYYRSGAGLAAGSAKSIGNIPANYRPSSIVESTGYLGVGNASPCDIWVETNGNAYIVSATAASSKFYGTLSYPLG